MLNKRILVLMFLLVFLPLVGCLPSDQVPIELTKIKVSPDTMILLKEDSRAFIVTAHYSDETSDEITSDCKYQSSDLEVADVIFKDPGFVVNTIDYGTTNIAVSYTPDGEFFTDTIINIPLTLQSTDGAESTTIQGSGTGSSNYMVRIYSSNVTFKGFTVTNPNYGSGADASGILVSAQYSDGGISNIQILNNTITGNPTGIKIDPGEGVTVSGLVINKNKITGNTVYGVENTMTKSVVDATNNWWGDASGPSYSSNPNGKGDAVSDNVDFDPWSTSPN